MQFWTCCSRGPRQHGEHGGREREGEYLARPHGVIAEGQHHGRHQHCARDRHARDQQQRQHGVADLRFDERPRLFAIELGHRGVRLLVLAHGSSNALRVKRRLGPQARRAENLDTHANVTRNHRCKTRERLLANAREYLDRYIWRRVTGAEPILQIQNSTGSVVLFEDRDR